MTFLAAVGMVSCVAVAAGAVWLLGRAVVRSVRRRAPEPEPVPEEIAAPEPPRPDCRYPEQKAAAFRLFKARYDALYDRLSVPEDAAVILKCSCAFSLEHIRISHYAWLADGALYFFPIWEDISLTLQDPAWLSPFRKKDREVLFGWKIPTACLDRYQVDGSHDITTTWYRDNRGNRYKTVFLDGGGVFFRSLFPERDAALLERRAYLGSRRNISDLRDQLGILKEAVEQSRISQEEYDREKRKILLEL